MARDPIPTWCFAVVVVRRGDEFLLVHEAKHGQLWYLPAGRVERAETFEAAALREALEETGLRVKLTGLIRVEHAVAQIGARMRVIFLAEPLDDAPPKSVPDAESLGAAWVKLADLGKYPLRGKDVRELLAFLQAGGPVFPLSAFVVEGSPYHLA